MEKTPLRMVPVTSCPRAIAPTNSHMVASMPACTMVKERLLTDVAKLLAISFAPMPGGCRQSAVYLDWRVNVVLDLPQTLMRKKMTPMAKSQSSWCMYTMLGRFCTYDGR